VATGLAMKQPNIEDGLRSSVWGNFVRKGKRREKAALKKTEGGGAPFEGENKVQLLWDKYRGLQKTRRNRKIEDTPLEGRHVSKRNEF